jgi:hypothetical protein
MHRAFPASPIFPGFIINTLVYAAIWFGVLFGPGFVKRTIRKKRGRCITCGYDLRGHARDAECATTCPECGRETPAAYR